MRILRTLTVSALLVVLARADNSPPAPAMPLLQRAVPLEAVTQAASARGIALGSIQVLSDDTTFALNDEATFLATVTEDQRLRQWLILLRAQDVTEQERTQYPAPERAIYTNLAPKPVVFAKEEVTGVAIRTIGPFAPGDKGKEPKDVWSGALLMPSALRLGLIQPSLIIGRMQERGLSGGIQFSGTPLPEASVTSGTELRAKLELTDEEVRGFAGFGPAVLNFFALANQTEGVNSIVREMIDIPWLSLVANGGRLRDVSFNMSEPYIDMPARYWGLSEGTRVRTLGGTIILNGKPSLRCVFALTVPRPPLYNTAGIVGLVAVRADGKGPILNVSLVGARPADERKPTGVRPGKR